MEMERLMLPPEHEKNYTKKSADNRHSLSLILPHNIRRISRLGAGHGTAAKKPQFCVPQVVGLHAHVGPQEQ
jgi:hypothetical protein